MKRILAFILFMAVVIALSACILPMAIAVSADDAAPVVTVEPAGSDLLIIVVIIAAALAVALIAYFLIKAIGLDVVNVALAVVTAVRDALENTNIAKTIFFTVLQMIIESLTYIQALYANALTTPQKVEKALDYIIDIACQLNMPFSQEQLSMIEAVLTIGFTVMDALGVGGKTSYKTMYVRMSKYAKFNKTDVAVGLTRLNMQIGARR